ncbi:hypothetical protein D0T53_02445 [Dysgonomonas sp. 216]|uniref:tape measure protein n=1 Tax=Dysgonomonas sp. 216 TaxID=2302934 RepID=UPI0013D1DEB9|nr:tape measure protein [Dysgonomonas sp. 216]NDW17774.1 hypothetical protein [Dysgonomonas sp. 216]
MNILSYTLRLNDQMSSTLSRVGASSNSTRSDVQDLREEVQQLDKTSVSGITSSMSGLAKIAGALGIGTLIGKGLATSVTAGMEREMQNVSFEVLFGGADKAKQMISEISDFGAKAYGSNAISGAVQMMKGFDVASDQIMSDLRVIGDIAMGDVNKFNSLSLAFAQMSSTGKLTGQDLLQMINAGFNPLTQMAKTTGKSVATLKDEMAKGLITSEMVKKSFYDATTAGGLYHNMIDRMASQTGGEWSRLQNTINERLIQLYDNILQPLILPVLRAANMLLTDTIGFVAKVTEKITNLNPVLLIAGGAMLAYASAIGIVKVATLAYVGVTKMLAFFKGIETAAWWANNAAMFANPVTWIVAGVIALIAVLAYLILKIDGWGAAWEHTVNGAKLIFKAYVESVKLYFNTMINGIMIGLNKIKEGWYEFKEAVGIGDSSDNQRMLQQIHADTEARKKAIVDGAKNVANLSIEAANEFKKAAGSFSWNDKSLSDVVGGLKGQLGISSPTVPGMEATGGGSGSGGGSTGGKGSKDAANAIATGGSKTTHVTINIGEMGNRIVINAANAKEGGTRMREIILDELTRVLSMAQGQLI